MNTGRLATMDGQVHATDIEQFYLATKDGDFPVVWTDGVANYGMPVGIITPPLPTYIGIVFNFFVHNPEISYNLLGLFAVMISGIFFYFFLRLYFIPEIAFFGVLLLTLSPFRIIDLYIRGDLAEILSGAMLSTILISIYKIVKQKNLNWFFVLSFSIFLLAIIHPMTLVTYSFLYIPYFLFIVFQNNKSFNLKNLISTLNIRFYLIFFLAALIGVGMASFYTLPLSLELKYFIEGEYKSLLHGGYLSLSNYFDPSWYYFTQWEIFTRGHFIKIGIPEILAVFLGTMLVIKKLIFAKKNEKAITFFDLTVVVALIVLFFTTPFSQIFYDNISILNKIEFPWRMLSVFIFLPPIIICFLFQKINNKTMLLAGIFLICFFRFPQVYGKNYTQYPLSYYLKTTSNLYAVIFNTVWMGKPEDYPIEKNKIGIISGKGKILSQSVSNSKRFYLVDAATTLGLVDYTFYFPGWNVYVDNIKTPIEFQDQNYRGVITYNVPKGVHKVSVIFEDTVVRRLSKILAIFFSIIFLSLFIFRKKLQKLLLQ